MSESPIFPPWSHLSARPVSGAKHIMSEGPTKRARASEAELDPIITLDVGGSLMRTRQSTLTWSSRYFKNVFEGPFKHQAETLFLDCDPDIFKFVLYFFRHHRLPQGAPLDKVKDTAALYSIDELLELTESRIITGHLVGTWKYWDDSEAQSSFTIYEKQDRLWLHFVTLTDDPDDTENNHAPLTRNGEFYDARESWGSFRCTPSGHVLLFNLNCDDDVDPSNLVPERLAKRDPLEITATVAPPHV